MRSFKNLSHAIGRVFSFLFIIVIRLYKILISPLLPNACRYYPTCSAYAEEAIRRFGFLKGGYLACKRVLSCNPFGGSGYDPVPDIFTFRKI